MTAETLLVRYGGIPSVSRFQSDATLELARGTRVVVRTDRGIEVGTVLEPPDHRPVNDSSAEKTQDAGELDGSWAVLRIAADDDESTFQNLRGECEAEYSTWCRRISDWNLNLELIDLEWTLDRGRLLLYVLNERGPDCTKLALHAAAAGLGLIEVQPVDAAGLVQLETSGGGCGSGGCGSGGCGT